MKMRFKQVLILALASVMLFALAACGGGGGGTAKGGYKVDEVKTKMAALLDIEESAIKVSERDGTTVLSYGLEEIAVDAYVMKDAKAAQDYFSIPAMAGSFDDKRVDETGRKVWVSEVENWATGESIFNTVAMKDNFIILSIGGPTPDEVVSAFDLN